MDIKSALYANGFAFKKKFGQNFITDENLLRAIVADAGVDGETTVLEVGAGAGTLTRALSQRAKRVVSYEIDETLEPVLRETLKGCNNVTLRFGDFMKCKLPELEKEIGNYLLVANLPYYITTPLIMRMVEESKRCTGLVVMVQEEVALRFSAEAGTKEYGAVTAAIARRGSVSLLRKVSRNLFTPRPNVDSAIVKIDFTRGGFEVKSEKAYRGAVRCAFLNRRKTLENNLISAYKISRDCAKEILREAEIEEGVRGETLSPLQLNRLAEVLHAGGLE